ncbi:MAG: hypothetical protein GDA50_07040 [Alphaproteobacteria bacterium GM202ARS2]|nr:hypothetical protein [Alphaproteobacteria bacterium GM202ARS2]
MIVVIQCSKRMTGEGYWREGGKKDGKEIWFVAEPDEDSHKDSGGRIVKKPGSFVEGSEKTTYLEALLEYNREFKKSGKNPCGLLHAWELCVPHYPRNIYERLFQKYEKNLYILSSGWGLIRADFLTPKYNLTFSYTDVKAYECRKHKDGYDGDLRCLPLKPKEPCVFFAAQTSLEQLEFLTRNVKGEKYLFYNLQDVPDMPGFILEKYDRPSHKTSWQYTCAKRFMAKEITI